MIAKNNPFKCRRTMVSQRAPSMSCKNPNFEIFTEINETLETLGPKFQNAQNFILRVSGGVLEKAVLSYAKICLNIQDLWVETLKRRGSYQISGTLGGLYEIFWEP
jgi:hypothetical protein